MADDDWYDARFDPYMLAVGKIATVWAGLEFAINQAIWELCNVDAGAGACITAQLIGSGPRMRALLALVDFRSSDPKSKVEDSLTYKLNKLRERIEGLGRQRNSYIHQYPFIGLEKGDIKRLEVTADRRLRFDYVPADFDAMGKLVNDIRQARSDFDSIFERVLAEFVPWPRTQYEQSTRGIRSLRRNRDTPP
jgi:hypothetical protein